jgi:peptidyl-prolyl cis-trans isomerase D
MRNAGRTWLGKAVVGVLFAFLILSFAVWGINDIFRGAPRNTVATVGGTDITADAFRNAYQGDIQQLMRQTRQSITPQQARAFGLDQQVLSRLVSETVLDRRAQDLGLGVSDQLLVRSITEDPRFRGPGGFERARLEAFLNERGQTEALFLRDQRGVVTRTQLAEAISGSLSVPVAMREAVHRYGSERRTAAYITLAATSVGDIPAPSEDQLKAFYEERKSSFRAPDYRAINVIAVDPASLAEPETVSEADARQRYEQIKNARFGAAERRTVQQIVVPDTRRGRKPRPSASSRGRRSRLSPPERNIDRRMLELGTFSRAEMVDPAVAEAAFASGEGATSEASPGPVRQRAGARHRDPTRQREALRRGGRRGEARDRRRAEPGNQITSCTTGSRICARAPARSAEIAKEKGLSLLSVRPSTGKARQGRQPGPGAPGARGAAGCGVRSDVAGRQRGLAHPRGAAMSGTRSPASSRRARAFRGDPRGGRGAVARRPGVARLADGREARRAARQGRDDRSCGRRRPEPRPRPSTISRARVQGRALDRGREPVLLGAGRQGRKVEAGEGARRVQGDGRERSRLRHVDAGAATPGRSASNLLADDLLAQYVAQAQAEMGVAINQQAVSRAVGGEI